MLAPCLLAPGWPLCNNHRQEWPSRPSSSLRSRCVIESHDRQTRHEHTTLSSAAMNMARGSYAPSLVELGPKHGPASRLVVSRASRLAQSSQAGGDKYKFLANFWLVDVEEEKVRYSTSSRGDQTDSRHTQMFYVSTKVAHGPLFGLAITSRKGRDPNDGDLLVSSDGGSLALDWPRLASERAIPIGRAH